MLRTLENGYIIDASRISYRNCDISFLIIYWHFLEMGDIMSENKLLDLSLEFAVGIVNLTDSIKVPKSSYMVDQLAGSGTSVGANIHEAQYAQSKKDFIS